jgi:hypothetical protein
MLWVGIDVAALVVGVVLAFRSPRFRKPATLVIIASGLSLLARAAFAITIMWADHPGRGGLRSGETVVTVFQSVSIVSNFCSMASRVLLVFAAFMWRDARAEEQTAVQAWSNRAAIGGADPGLVGVAGAPMPLIPHGSRITAIVAISILGGIASVAAFIIGPKRGNEGVAFALLGVGMLLTIAGIVLVMMTLHALWKSIQLPPVGRGQPGLARTTPAMAVGLLFVPLFNLYWAFQVLPGFATDVNRVLDATGVNGPRASRGLGVAWCVCAILGMIPFVGIVIGLAGLVIVPFYLSTAIRAANAVRAA